MQDKLQELTDRLYEEGLSKGKAEAEEVLAKAKNEAIQIIEDARKKAQNIISEAESESSTIKARFESDIRMAATQTVSSVKQTVEEVITSEAINPHIDEALEDEHFVKELIMTIARSFDASSSESGDLNLILPSSMKETLSKKYEKEIASKIARGINVTYSKSLNKGFRIGPKKGGYLLSFTDEDFSGMMKQYLRPLTRKILFGE